MTAPVADPAAHSIYADTVAGLGAAQTAVDDAEWQHGVGSPEYSNALRNVAFARKRMQAAQNVRRLHGLTLDL